MTLQVQCPKVHGVIDLAEAICYEFSMLSASAFSPSLPRASCNFPSLAKLAATMNLEPKRSNSVFVITSSSSHGGGGGGGQILGHRGHLGQISSISAT